MSTLKTIALLSAAAATALSSSCAATRGFGQDLQKIGGKVEDRADATGGAAPAPTTTTTRTTRTTVVVPPTTTTTTTPAYY